MDVLSGIPKETRASGMGNLRAFGSAHHRNRVSGGKCGIRSRFVILAVDKAEPFKWQATCRRRDYGAKLCSSFEGGVASSSPPRPS